ncbi:hypothetical protein C8N40_10512 [Pontibacter mucosus]|uniref:Uncharacterized protein n=1 Tax=Pontibacter mucosus TaxID=1649266 RepID=A0A2T5YHE0_9BACT|nr:hypothetical protein C8N40_10512 [Pontibacter mucosus]
MHIYHVHFFICGSAQRKSEKIQIGAFDITCCMKLDGKCVDLACYFRRNLIKSECD